MPSTVTDSSEDQYHPNRATFLSEILYAMTDEEFNQFASRHQLTDTNALFSKTNALQKYNESWTTAKQLLYINTIFTVLVLLLEGLIITSIIKLEYQVNALVLVLLFSIWNIVWFIMTNNRYEAFLSADGIRVQKDGQVHELTLDEQLRPIDIPTIRELLHWWPN